MDPFRGEKKGSTRACNEPRWEGNVEKGMKGRGPMGMGRCTCTLENTSKTKPRPPKLQRKKEG